MQNLPQRGILNRQCKEHLFLDSSMVEHTAVNRGVVGSSPTRGVIKKTRRHVVCLRVFLKLCMIGAF